MRRAYESWNPRGETLVMIEHAERICRSYLAQGYDLTLRQLYYQFVAQGILPNNMKSYTQLKNVVSKARMAGLLDWSYIVDRTRNLRGTAHWTDPSSVIRAAADGYALDKWRDQPARVELWVEKEALAGVIERTAAELDLDWFACRGYVSQSEQWRAGQRFGRYIEGGQRVVILHLGDHDPSGIDMTRDIEDRLRTFIYYDYAYAHRADLGGAPTFGAIGDVMREGLRDGGEPFEVRRIALNMDQVLAYDPPPNPAKLTDSRAAGYIDVHGNESWELDALDPATLDGLIREHVEGIRDEDLYEVRLSAERVDRLTLTAIADNYPAVAEEYGNEE